MRKYNIPIIMYHCINDRPNENPLGFLSFSTSQFRQHLRYFKRHGFQCVKLTELYRIALKGRLGKYKLAVLTFDDGFLDNWLIVCDMVEKFGASGTVFVNPDFANDGPVRTLKDVPNTWGNLNYAEMRELERRGTLDIQSHTMTHNFEFCSEKVIDCYSPDKFKKYYWLAWKLYPQEKPNWCCKLEKLERLVPTGYPIFEYDRAITSKCFLPSAEFIKLAINNFSESSPDYIKWLNEQKDRGQFESEQQWEERVKYELERSKELLERKLEKQVEFLCFPGGAYNVKVLKIAERAGYKAYMISSKEKTGSNYERLKEVSKSQSIIGLERVSFTKDYPSLFKSKIFSYLNCKLKIDSYMGRTWANILMRAFRSIRDLIRKAK